jgi:hypothetical protein
MMNQIVFIGREGIGGLTYHNQRHNNQPSHRFERKSNEFVLLNQEERSANTQQSAQLQ